MCRERRNSSHICGFFETLERINFNFAGRRSEGFLIGIDAVLFNLNRRPTFRSNVLVNPTRPTGLDFVAFFQELGIASLCECVKVSIEFFSCFAFLVSDSCELFPGKLF